MKIVLRLREFRIVYVCDRMSGGCMGSFPRLDVALINWVISNLMTSINETKSAISGKFRGGFEKCKSYEPGFSSYVDCKRRYSLFETTN